MKVLYSKPEIVDQLTMCSRNVKGKTKMQIVQPLIANDFDKHMGGVDIGYVNFTSLPAMFTGNHCRSESSFTHISA